MIAVYCCPEPTEPHLCLACLFVSSEMLRILNPDRSLFWGPFWWPQLMSWGNHARSLQCRCEESVVQRCVGWDSQEGALHHANSLIGVGGSGKTSIESLQQRNACVPDVCVSSRKQPACTRECRWSDSKLNQNRSCRIWRFQYFVCSISRKCGMILIEIDSIFNILLGFKPPGAGPFWPKWRRKHYLWRVLWLGPVQGPNLVPVFTITSFGTFEIGYP